MYLDVLFACISVYHMGVNRSQKVLDYRELCANTWVLGIKPSLEEQPELRITDHLFSSLN